MSPRKAERAVLALAALLAACTGGPPRSERPAGDTMSAAGTETAASATGDAAQPLVRYAGIGRTPTAAEIRAWDIDVNPRGVGLPAGRGTYRRGAAVYAQRCAACHGRDGEGMSTNPRLIGREPADFSFARLGPGVPRTIGNYWPYATTLFDYINRAMPFDAPGSLPPEDVYSVVAFLLARNGIVDSSSVVDARTLPSIVMPARDRFVPDDRAGGAVFR